MARDWWQKGRAFDLWSIPHFLFGVLMAFLPPLASFSLISALSLTVILAMLWELYERFANLQEAPLNSSLDIVLAISAFVLTSFLFSRYALRHDELLVALTAIFIVYVFTNISGWLAYRRRARDFMR